MSIYHAKIRTSHGIKRVRRFRASAEDYAPTPDQSNTALRTVTHLPTGYRIGKRLEDRQAELLAAIADRIVPGQNIEEVMRNFVALPTKVKVWLAAWETEPGPKRRH